MQIVSFKREASKSDRPRVLDNYENDIQNLAHDVEARMARLQAAVTKDMKTLEAKSKKIYDSEYAGENTKDFYDDELELHSQYKKLFDIVRVQIPAILDTLKTITK